MSDDKNPLVGVNVRHGLINQGLGIRGIKFRREIPAHEDLVGVDETRGQNLCCSATRSKAVDQTDGPGGHVHCDGGRD